MALKNTLDPAAVGERLAAWLPGVLHVDGPVEVSDVVIPHASGFSSETVLLSASWEDADGRQERGLVVRVPPTGVGLFPDYDIAREARVMRAIREHSDLPVAEVLAHEDTGDVLGAPFLLVDRVYGEVPADDPPFVAAGFVVDLPPERRAVLWDAAVRTLAGLAAVDPAEAGLADFGHDQPGASSLRRELAYWRAYYEWAAGDAFRSPTIEAAFDRLEATAPDIEGGDVVVWGDARFGNLMFGPDQEVTGVFDWEMATLGPPEVDFAYFLFFDRLYSQGLGLPRLEGFPDRDATIARYEELTGHALREIDWFEAWASLRGACTIVRVGALMIEHGFLPEGHAMPLNNPASQVLASLLELPPPAGDSGWVTGNRG